MQGAADGGSVCAVGVIAVAHRIRMSAGYNSDCWLEMRLIR